MLQPFQNITLVAFNRTRYTPEKNRLIYSSDLHWHNFFQIVYVHRGNGFLQLENTAYPLEVSQCLLIWPNEPHRLASSESMETYEMKFILPEALASQLPQEFHHPCRDTSGAVMQTFLQIEAETKSIKDAGYSQNLAILSLLRILLLLQLSLENAENTAHKAVLSAPDPLLEQYNAYIDANLHRSFTIKEMAGFFCTEYTHFSRNFTAKYGIRLRQFVNQRRVERASDLLVSTDLSITEIAEQCGFETRSNLDRNFTAVKGYSPTQHRQFYQSGTLVAFRKELNVNHLLHQKSEE